MLGSPNRILAAIERRRDQIAAGLKPDGTPFAANVDLAQVERTLDNSVLDHFHMQTTQSRAHAMGKLTHAEAQTIYAALGEVPAADGWAEGTDLATKVVVTQVIAELIKLTR